MKLLSILECVLVGSHGLLACALWFLWLWRNRRVRVPVYRLRRSGRLQGSDSMHPRAKPDWVRARVIYLASHLRGCRTIARAFNACHGPWTTVGKIMDAGSRKLLRLKLIPGKSVHVLLGHLHLAFAEHGLPQAIRTDNEAMFTSTVWAATLKALAIVHRRGPPLQPWHNGRVERLMGTLKGVLRQLRIDTAAGLQAVLDEFKAFYNVCRRHSALDGLTPQEAWSGKTMADVQHGYALRGGGWVEAFTGILVAYHVRC